MAKDESCSRCCFCGYCNDTAIIAVTHLALPSLLAVASLLNAATASAIPYTKKRKKRHGSKVS
jgi:hypothetical protein